MRGPLRGVCREMRGGAAEEIPQPFCKEFLLAFAFPHHQNVPAIALQAISLALSLVDMEISYDGSAIGWADTEG